MSLRLDVKNKTRNEDKPVRSQKGNEEVLEDDVGTSATSVVDGA